ncbi:MAG TPA: TonB family protein [Pyrinomonadaceae bacterium]|nr:TonB family protein [Pyrinomonadaceae bacterium]
MFNNLIESSSHAREFKRRGSFVLFTSTTYALLFIVAGVISIYAYDARLEEPLGEIIMVNPVDLEVSKSETVRPKSAPAMGGHSGGALVRKDPMADVDPRLVPKTISAARITNPVLPSGVPITKDNFNSDPGGSGPGNSNRGGTGGGGEAATRVRVDVDPPPPAPVQKPKPAVVQRKVINGDALWLPKPPYPPIAKQLGIQGTVNVQVLVDETGKVISAKVAAGNPALARAAQQAALNARFSPTMIGEQAVKVSGIIIYNFVLQ